MALARTLGAVGKRALVAALLASVATSAFAQDTDTLPGSDVPQYSDSSYGAPQAGPQPPLVDPRYDLVTSDDWTNPNPDYSNIQDDIDAINDDPRTRVVIPGDPLRDEESDDLVYTDAERRDDIAAIRDSVQNPDTSGATCVEQLDPVAFGLNVAGAGVDLGGVIAEIAGAFDTTGVAEAAAIAIQAVGTALNLGSVVVEGVQMGLPNCEGEFTGTLKTHANIIASQGISAMNGQIHIGHPDGQQYEGGVALGGGALLGAGFTGFDEDLPISDGVNSVAIGNRAHAGTTTVNGDIIGNVALGADSVALGLWANAFGTSAVAGISDGAGGFLTVDYATAIGGSALASGVRSTASGSFAIASGVQSSASGNDAQATHLQATASGASSRATEDFTTAGGALSEATDQYASAYGHGSRAFGEFSTAVGATSRAGGTYASAYGQGAQANGVDATAVGARSFAGWVNSAAFGVDAVATMNNQQMFGTAENTYTMPGIVSAQSTARQVVGAKGIVTTDEGGNLAADQELYNQIGQNREGVAMAMALGNFWVPESKQFAVGLNTATWDGVWAAGLNVGGEIGDGFYVTGGMAVSQSGMMGGRVGGVMSW